MYRIRSQRWSVLMDYAAIEWRDGQPYSASFDDIYFSVNDGRSESEYVFLQQNHLAERFADAERFVIAETGLGTGLNFVLTLKLWEEHAPVGAQLDYFGIDFAPLSPDDIKRAARCWPELERYFSELLNGYPLPVAGRHVRYSVDKRVRLHLVFADITVALQNESLAVNAWYLDGFSPAKNPDIWNQKVYALIAQNSAQDATLATYSAAGNVRRGLEQAGFSVEKRAGHGNKREMITARWSQCKAEIASVPPWYRLPVLTTTEKHAVVIGAGLAGLTVAWSLIQRGWRITLIDKQTDVAMGASGNPAGLVLPRFSIDDTVDARFYSSAFLHAIANLDKLQGSHVPAVNNSRMWRGDGVYCAMPSARVQRMLGQNKYHTDYIHCVENTAASVQLPIDATLLLVPRAGWASPALICQALLTACGDSLHYRQENVAALNQITNNSTRRWELVSATGKIVADAETLIIANGTDATRYAQTAWLPVKSARGQLTELKLKAGVSGPDHAFSFEHYLAPSLSDAGKYYCGASYHLDDHCAELRESDQQINQQRIEKYFPDIFEFSNELSGRVGFRAVSADRLPVVGAVPDSDWFETEYQDLHFGRPPQNYAAAKYLQGLYISAAHGSRGITSCFLCAEIIAAQIEQTALPVEQDVCTALNPARFIVRRLKSGG